ncbi:MAG TPA: zinc-dependent metalloprotease [Planctomycetota bacterium]|nr:zinc-dependent metalloprotease [Planctomycetota bacterium]
MRRTFLILLPLLSLAARLPAEEGEEDKKPDFTPWEKAGKDMEAAPGFWTVLEDKKHTKFWVEIPERQLEQSFLMATSISGGTRMRGWQWNDWLLMWRLHDKKLVLLERNVGVQAKGRKELEEAVERTYTDRVLASFPIVARGPNGGYVLDGRIVFGDNATLFLGGIARSKDSSLSSFKGTKNFPENSEVRVTLPDAGGTLITLAYSISGLKETGYKPRLADDRVGYFTTDLIDFSADNKDENRRVRYVNRWHLEKEDDKLDLSPPKKRIEFYIEKSVPVKFQRYVREGILEWNRALAKVGFDEAIVVYQQTENRYADLDPEDIRYNFFRWIYSETPFAMGPSRVDPRTGQILDADIIMDDSMVRSEITEYRLLIREVPEGILQDRDSALLENGPFRRFRFSLAPEELAIPGDAARPNLPPHARRAFCGIGRGANHELGLCGLLFNKGGEGASWTDELPEELVGQYIKDTVMHEVGHTLGLRHNFKSSIYRTFDEINSEVKPDEIAGSVMDYNPVDIAPEGRPQGNYAMRTIGPYDYWAIEYGYTPKKDDLPAIAARGAEKGHDYATDEDTIAHDPLTNRWDLGTDPLAYAKDRTELMKRVRKDLVARAVDKGERYHRLRRAMDMQFWQTAWCAGIASRFVGGEYLNRDHRGDPGERPALVPVPAEKQREALHWICDEILSGRYFQFDPELLQKLAPNFWADDFWEVLDGYDYPVLDNTLAVQMRAVLSLTAPSRLQRVISSSHKLPAGTAALEASEIFDALEGAIFAGLADLGKRNLTDMERNLQREYVGILVFLLLDGYEYYPSEIQTLSRHYVKQLSGRIQGGLGGGANLDTATRAHLEECAARLDRALEASYTLNR